MCMHIMIYIFVNCQSIGSLMMLHAVYRLYIHALLYKMRIVNESSFIWVNGILWFLLIGQHS